MIYFLFYKLGPSLFLKQTKHKTRESLFLTWLILPNQFLFFLIPPFFWLLPTSHGSSQGQGPNLSCYCSDNVGSLACCTREIPFIIVWWKRLVLQTLKISREISGSNSILEIFKNSFFALNIYCEYQDGIWCSLIILILKQISPPFLTVYPSSWIPSSTKDDDDSHGDDNSQYLRST